MPTRPHGNGRDGYSLRVSKNVPNGAANLAYVYNEASTPQRNLSIEDLSTSIPENRLMREYKEEFLVYPNEESMLHSLEGVSEFPSKDILITDEYSTGTNPKALYWKYRSQGRFDARNSLVSIYKKGFDPHADTIRFEELTLEERDDLIYLGTQIEVVTRDGKSLENEAYKIKLVKNGTEGFVYSIEVYTNFYSNDEVSYQLKYKKWENGKSREVLESLNVEPFFEQVSKEEVDALTSEADKMQKKFALVSEGENQYKVYAKAPQLIADEVSRPSHRFTYQVKANLNARLSEQRKATLNVGYAYINDTEFGASIRNLTSVGKKMFAGSNNYLPSYLRFENPHTENENAGKESIDYWLVNLDMPEDHYLDYDILIIGGYGTKNLSRFQLGLQAFLENGGKLLVDNNGTGASALNFKVNGQQTFIRNVSFSTSATVSAPRAYADSEKKVIERYFPLKNAVALGSVSPSIEFGSGEGANDWKAIVKHTDQNNAMMYRKHGNGYLIVSNMGLLTDLLLSKEESNRLFANLMLWAGEERFIAGPVVKEFVYHRNNLFDQEYKDAKGNLVYIDDRAIEDETQIVAKKLLAPSVAEALRPHLPQGFQDATGTYQVVVNTNTSYPVLNQEFELVNGSGTTSWTTTTLNAIPNWNTILFSGSATFSQTKDAARNNVYGMKIVASNGQAFVENSLGVVPAGSYIVEGWVNTTNVTGVGTKIGIYLPSGQEVVKSSAISGTSTWKKISLSFTLAEAKDLRLRVGHVDGNGSGTSLLDGVQMESIGVVRMNRPNLGNERLIAYATATKGQGIDFQNAGFDTSDVVIHHPVLEASFTTKAYVYSWNPTVSMYQKVYGDSTVHRFQIKKDDGLISLGNITQYLPPLKAGAMWADATRVYYEFEVGDVYEETLGTNYVNLNIYNPQTGKSFFLKKGQTVISHYDIYGKVLKPEVILQAWTNYYTVQATKKQFALQLMDGGQIKVEYPGTDDSRERWYLRVHKGDFVKTGWNGEDWEAIQEAGRLSTYEERMTGKQEYEIIEYGNQVFYPTYGMNDREEIAEYMDTKTVRVDRRPMVVREQKVVKEELEAISSDRKKFQASLGKWNRKVIPIIYWDETNSGTDIILNSGFTIDYEAGTVTFTTAKAGTVRASYTQDNFKVVKRKYLNERINNELLKTTDRKRWVSSQENWLTSPTPIIYRNGVVIPNDQYKIDYASGDVIFTTTQKERIYADYNYFIEEELEVEDVDVLSGLIRLKKEITFKDEIYVTYMHEEQYYNYKGYWDEELKRFMHLDLNPAVGHTFTLRKAEEGEVVYEEAPTEKLLNKEVFLYLLPKRTVLGPIVRTEANPLRHVLSEEEWKRIKQARPEAMLLARIQVREHTLIDNTIVMDARKRGGGLKESFTRKEIEQRAGAVESFWDIGTFDGKAYYEKGVVVIRLPKEILRSEGGQFEEEDIQARIKKYLALGIYPIIEYV